MNRKVSPETQRLPFLFTLVLLILLLAGCTVDNAVIHTLSGNSQRGLGNFDQAILEYNQAISLNPNLAEAYYNRGDVYDLLGDYDNAITDFDKTIALKPDWAEAYRVRGRAYRMSGNLEHAIEDFDKAIALNPNLGDAYIGRGLAYGLLGDNDRAMQDYNKGIELSPEVAETYSYRADLYAAAGDNNHAFQDYAKAIELAPDYPDPYYWRGLAFYNRANDLKAIEDFDKVIELAPDYANAYFMRGLSHYNLANYEQAIQNFDKAIELNPKDVEAYYWLGAAYDSLGDYEHVIQQIDSAIELGFHSADAYYLRGIAHSNLRHTEQAVQDLRIYLDLKADAPDRVQVEVLIAELQRPPLVLEGQPEMDPVELRERPLLHWDLPEQKEKQVQLAATLAGGRRIGTYPAPGAVWSPNGDHFAFVAGEGIQEALYVMNLAGDAQLIFTPNLNEGLITWHPAWSPDGQRLAVIVGHENEEGVLFTLVVVDVATKQTLSRYAIPDGTLLIPISMSPPNNFRWSPDGQKILISWENAVVIDLENERTISISEHPVVAEWTPEGDGVYYFTIDNYDQPRDRALGGFFLKKLNGGDPLQLMDANDLAAQGLTMAPAFYYGLMILSPSGSKLAFVGGAEKQGASTINIYELKQGETLVLDQPASTFQIDTPVAALEWSPDELNVALVAVEQDGALAIKLLEMATAEWQDLAKLQMDWSDGGLEWLGLVKIISWTY